jgi:hypothetical protein
LVPIEVTVISELPALKKRLATEAPTILSPFANWATAPVEISNKKRPETAVFWNIKCALINDKYILVNAKRRVKIIFKKPP